MRIAVVGVGAIGGYFAYQAVRAGHEVVLCARTPFEQLVVVEPDGREHGVDARVHTRATDGVGDVPADWVLLATKAHQVEAAADWLRAVVGEPTRAVLALQNGVEHEQRTRPLIGDLPLLPATVMCASEAVAPGRIVHHDFARLEVPAGALADELAKLYAGTDVEIVPVDDMTTALWRKLMGNVVANPITALTGQRLRVVARPGLRSLATGLLREAIAVGRAEGADLDPALADSMIAGFAQVDPGTGSSMLYDRLAGRPMEIDALNGAVVRMGVRHGIPTPLNEAVVGLVAAISDAVA